MDFNHQLLVPLFIFLLFAQCESLIQNRGGRPMHRPLVLHNDKLNRDLGERSRRKAQGEGGGEMAAGAVLGGLIAGPFGVLFGAQIGANMGAKKAIDRARKEEMEKLGITQDMLDAAEEIGAALEQSSEGLSASRASLETQQALARRLENDSDELLRKAKLAISSGDEEGARSLLLQKNDDQEKLVRVLKLCAEERKRVKTMEENVEALERRALEVESLLQRSMGAKARENASIDNLSLSSEDPLLQKFKDLGID